MSLYLSHWEDKNIFVTEKHLEDLNQHHVDCLRTLYQTYYKKLKGKLITYPKGINIAIIIRAFLSAIIKDLHLPVLIICDITNISLWNYEMKKISNVKVLNYESKIKLVDSSSIILTTFEKLKENPLGIELSIVIGENIELLVNKLVFKRIVDVEFKIALSNLEFYHDNDTNLKVFWHIFHWCNPNLFGKLITFIDTHKDHYNNLRDPYDDVWHRIEWDLPEDFQSEIENNEYLLQNCEFNFSMLKNTRNSNKRVMKDTNGRKLKKSKSTKESDCNLERSTFSNFQKAKSANDLDSLKIMMEEGPWIEEYMLEMDVSQFSNEIKIPDSMENISSSLLSQIEKIVGSKKVEEDEILDSIDDISSTLLCKIDRKIDEYCIKDASTSNNNKGDGSSSLLIERKTEENAIVVSKDNEMEISDSWKNISPGLLSQIEEKAEKYPILDAIISGGSLKTAVEDYNSQISNRFSPTTSQTDEKPEEYPILDAIIKGSPLKKAIEEFKCNVLGRSHCDDDIFNLFTQKTSK